MLTIRSREQYFWLPMMAIALLLGIALGYLFGETAQYATNRVLQALLGK